MASVECASLVAALERDVVARARTLEERAPLSHMLVPVSSGAPTGPVRHARLNEALDSFGLVRSKGQRNFHRNMTQAIIRKVYKTDFNEHLDVLREQFRVDTFKPEVMIITPRRWGKCLGADTLVLLADGGTRRAADVRVGDVLVGDDGRARIVMNTCTGRAPMFRINEASTTPSEDASFTCNDDHLLVFEMRGHWVWLRRREHTFEVVRRSYVDGKLQTREHTQTFHDEPSALAALERTQALYSTRPTTTLRAGDVHRALDGDGKIPEHFATPRRRVDHFPRAANIDAHLAASGVNVLDFAYYVGLWLGDGTAVRTNEITVCTRTSPEIVDFLKQFAAANGLFANCRADKRRPNVVSLLLSTTEEYTAKRRRKSNVVANNPVQQALVAIGVDVNKNIGSILMGASRDVRLQLLAGLMDSDGHYMPEKGGYDFVQKRRALALDVARLSRSLGLAVRIHTRTANDATYARLYISGSVDIIPCRLPRKRAVGPLSLRIDYERYTTSIEALGDGAYYGFQCAAVVDEADAERVSASIASAHASGGDDAVTCVAAALVLERVLLPSLANGASVDGRYPGRFLLASHTVVHNTFSVAMFVAACAFALEGTHQSIFSTGRRASKALLELVYRFLCKLPGMKDSIIVHNVETIHIQGPHGPDDVRKISSYPSKVRYELRCM